MRNIVGQTATGNDFYPRNKVIQKIYRRLDTGAGIFMAAPRRVGKTSIMLRLQDEARENYEFVYTITSSIKSSEVFFQTLLLEVLKSEVISKLSQAATGTRNLLKEIIDKIGSVGIPGIVKIDLQDEKEAVSYREQLEKLLVNLDLGTTHLVIMVDEFPDTIENIKQAEGIETAKTFLQQNRELRQKAHPNIHFIYTGSIGLPLVVKKIMTLNVIGDLNIVEVPPLDKEEATDLIIQLLQFYEVTYQPQAIDYLLEQLEWWIPFHIQLAVQEIIDVFENKEKAIDNQAVDFVFDELLNIRNDIYFNHYYSRLKQSFQNKEEYHFAMEVLNHLSTYDGLSATEVPAISNVYHHQLDGKEEIVLDSLVFDGYITFSEEQQCYAFNSLLLKKWWNKKKFK